MLSRKRFKVKDVAYDVYRYKDRHDSKANYYTAQAMVRFVDEIEAKRPILLSHSVMPASLAPWPMKLYDDTTIFWLKTIEEVEDYLKLHVKALKEKYAIDAETYDGYLAIEIGNVGSLKGFVNFWIDYPEVEDIYSSDINLLISRYFPKLKGLEWRSLVNDFTLHQVPQGFDAEYGLVDLPSSLEALCIHFKGPLDLSALLGTKLVYLSLYDWSLGDFTNDFCFDYDHAFSGLRVVVTPWSHHRSTQICTTEVSASSEDHPIPFNRRMYSFRRFT